MIEIKHLTKFFGTKKAVDDIAFTVGKGEILGFLGPNGAGKSTTMRMITGFIPPSQGTAVIGGHDILTHPIEARRKIGYLPENAPVYPEMTVSGFLDFCAAVRGYSKAERQRRIDAVIETCFLSSVRHQEISTLSKGYKQRVCFAQSIIHDPEYLIMDEPTDGLDPNQKHEVRLMIKEMSATKAILLSTHILDEVEAVCSRAIIIAEGRIVADDTPRGLCRRSRYHGAVCLTLPHAAPEELLSQISAVSGVSSAEIVRQEEQRLTVRAFPASPETRLTAALMAFGAERGYSFESLFAETGRLDEVFRNITITT